MGVCEVVFPQVVISNNQFGNLIYCINKLAHSNNIHG